MQPVKESAQKVQAKLKELGYANQVVELPDSTRTAAAGHPKAVFRLTPEQLVQMTNGQVACIASCR
ncbi:hypothetical protein [Brevibacillus agri]|uniref:hypothetical protein n=1 Tax=Brevibacillus agri TaxID=51101 RepID=UPI003D1FE5D0